MSNGYSPVLMIGIDAAEPRLVDGWMDDGTMPVLRGLRDRGRTAGWPCPPAISAARRGRRLGLAPPAEMRGRALALG